MADPVTVLVTTIVRYGWQRYTDRKKQKRELYRRVDRLLARPDYDISFGEVEQLLDEIDEYNPENRNNFKGLRELKDLYEEKRYQR
ncbi:5756_t:CDS:1, partial [Ambispora gerdemannii]